MPGLAGDIDEHAQRLDRLAHDPGRHAPADNTYYLTFVFRFHEEQPKGIRTGALFKGRRGKSITSEPNSGDARNHSPPDAWAKNGTATTKAGLRLEALAASTCQCSACRRPLDSTIIK